MAACIDPSPFPQNFPPDPPALVAPIDQSNGVPTVPELSVMLADPDLQPLDVTFYGRRKLSAADDFTIVGLPDTQYYSAEKNDGTRDIFYTQTQWITDNMADDVDLNEN